MTRDEGAFRRRVAEEVSAQDDSADSSESTQVMRDGAAHPIDIDQVETVNDTDDGADETPRMRPVDAAYEVSPDVGEPPHLPEAMDLAGVGPDGSSLGGGGLTDPTGADVGGGSVSDQVRGRAEGLGGDALGRGIDFDVGSRGSDRDLSRAIGNRDGSQLSEVVQGEEIVFDLSENDSEVVQGEEIVFDISEDDSSDGMDVEIGTPVDVTDYGGGMSVEFGDIDVVNPPGSGDEIIGPGYAQPDPTGGDDVITGESVAAAIRAHSGPGDPEIFRGSEDASVTGYGTNLADNDPDNITNYGPEGPQTVESGTWERPGDLIFDPPPEGASAAMAGTDMALADPGAALGGSGMIGSSTPDEAPPPPDPPPGDDPDQGPLGPPGGGGGEG